MPDGERVTTGSEPRRFSVTCDLPGVGALVAYQLGGRQLNPGERVEVVEPGHDEQTEHPYAVMDRQAHIELLEARAKLQRFVNQIDNTPQVRWVEEALGGVEEVLAALRGGPPEKSWQPDPRTVAAVVEALPHASEDGCTINVAEMQAWLRERFKPSAPGGDDGH